jgi:hypothetical protein
MISNKIQLTKPTRKALACVAECEAKAEFRGGTGMAGPEIERYLSVFRDALNLNGSTDKYSDKNAGYHWCGAFVYYCCSKAGFIIPEKPVPSFRYTLAAVPAWHHWANATEIYHEDKRSGQIGDIVIYNCVYDNNPLDHIGIVTKVFETGIMSAEGNNDNRTGLFHRSYDFIAGFVRLPEN